MKTIKAFRSLIALLLLMTTFNSNSMAQRPSTINKIGWVAFAMLAGYVAYKKFLSYMQEEPTVPLNDNNANVQAPVAEPELTQLELAMKQILLNERTRDIQQLQERLKGSLNNPMQLQQEIERLQNPIDLYLLEPSQDLRNQAQQIQGQATAEQLALLDQMQQRQLEQMQAALEQWVTEQQEQEEECIVCMEKEDICAIPCRGNHTDRICKSCVADIKNKTNSCPICRKALL